MSEPAQVRRDGAIVEAKFHYSFDHPPERVWAFLTDEALLPVWLAPGRISGGMGGPVRLDFKDSGIVIDSLVTAFERERLLEYSWSGPGEPYRAVRWRLEPAGEGRCELVLILQVPAVEDAARAFAGWDAHLEMLAAALEDVPIRFPFEHFKTRRAAYTEELQATAG